MLSTARHHYSPMFSPLPSDIRSYSSGLASPQRIQTSGLESFCHASPFALQPIQTSSLQGHGIGPVMKSPTKVRHHPYETLHNANNGTANKLKDARRASAADEKGNSGPIRRRISRACDQCNQLRTKCDGQAPCAHCIGKLENDTVFRCRVCSPCVLEFSLACEYFRERKKRGKASRKDIAQQQAAAAAATVSSGTDTNSPCTPTFSEGFPTSAPQSAIEDSKEDVTSQPRPSLSSRSLSAASEKSSTPHMSNGQLVVRSNSMGGLPDHMQMTQTQQMSGIHEDHTQHGQMDDGSAHLQVNSFGMLPDLGRQPMPIHPLNAHMPINTSMMQQLPQPLGTPNSFAGYSDAGFPLLGAHDPPAQSSYPFSRAADSPLASFLAGSPVNGSSGWLSSPSPNSGNFPSTLLGAPSTLRYPVLQPIISKLKSIIPNSLACDLLELYFTSSSTTQMHPLSPYLLGFVFRKRSFLHPSHPRRCSPALLASMLWVAAQSSDAPFLTSPPSARGRICQKLLELTVGLLRPLIHGPGGSDMCLNFGTNAIANGVSLSGLGVPSNGDHLAENDGPTATVDDVATYFHLATVVSASEYKAASLRWWNAAWSLARELKLGRELPPNPPTPAPRDLGQSDEADADGDVDIDMGEQHLNGTSPGQPLHPTPGTYTEEEREERRRIWWLLYTVDRHLALCYNRPLFLLDAECADLLQPIAENKWQSGEVYTGDENMFTDPTHPQRRQGPTFECTSHSIFGYFTPLMTILGEIVELNQARNHPRFGLTFRQPSDWDQQVAEITQHLEIYGRSLKEFEARSMDPEHRPEVGTPSVRSTTSGTSRMSENVLQTKIVAAYGTHVLHVLYILLHGKWDPISLLDDSDLWISSQSFISAMQHAVSGAEAISDILEYDPDLSFMPFFFGIYLLQGSFLLLLIADKLQGEASSNVVNACETVVRAVEACVVTLNTEYQVSRPCSDVRKVGPYAN